MSYDVFVCHANQDKAVADAVCARLEENGISCWIAPRDIPAGKKWDVAITEALPQCRIIVIIFSAQANVSDYCINEVGIAFESKKEIIPLRIDDTVPSGAMQLYLRNRQWIDAQKPGLEPQLDKLVKEVKVRLKKESVLEKPEKEQESGQAHRGIETRGKTRKTWVWAVGSILAVAAVVILLLVIKPWGGNGNTLPPTTPTTTVSETTTPPPTTEPPTTSPTTTPPTTEAANIPPTTTPPPAPYGTITIASETFNNQGMDAMTNLPTWAWALYDPLITQDEKGNYIGAIAENWTISPDGNTWTFKIRQGIEFHNGNPLTAEDVKFSVDSYGAENSTGPWHTFLSTDYNKVSSTVIDTYTFQYITDHPEPALFVPFSNVLIIPKEYYERVGQDYFLAHPVGSGPWKFVEHVWDTRFKMEANTNYWGEVPAYQYVIDLYEPGEAEQIAMFERGEVDYITVSDDKLVELQNAGYRSVAVGLPILANISLQGTWFENAGSVHDIRVRQALSYAINRQEICDTLYHGNAIPGGTFYMQPGCWGWTDELVADNYDPNKARALLAAAGHTDGVSDIHIYFSDVSLLDLLVLLQSQWEQVGIHVQLETVSPQTFFSYMFNSNEITGTEPYIGWGWPWIASGTYNSIYHVHNMYCTGGLHATSNDTTADALYDKAFNELDPTLALEYYQDFLLYARSMYVNIGICQIKPMHVVSDNPGEFTNAAATSIYNALAGIKH